MGNRWHDNSFDRLTNLPAILKLVFFYTTSPDLPYEHSSYLLPLRDGGRDGRLPPLVEFVASRREQGGAVARRQHGEIAQVRAEHRVEELDADGTSVPEGWQVQTSRWKTSCVI